MGTTSGDDQQHVSAKPAPAGGASPHALAGLLGKLVGRFDERRVCLALLYAAARDGQLFDMTSLAAALGQSRPTASRLVARLIAAGEVCEQPAGSDRRRRLLGVTAAGAVAGRAELVFLDEILAAALAEQQSAAAHRIRPVKVATMSEDQALPVLRRLAAWGRSGSDSIPLDLFDAVWVFEPDFAALARSPVRHWGQQMRTGRESAAIDRLGAVVHHSSHEYYRMLAQHFAQGLRGMVLHQIEIDWLPRYKTYQRILIPHARFGIFACSRFMDA